MLEQFNYLDVDTQKATLSAMTLLSILLLLCCVSKWILYLFTAFFTCYAIFLAWKTFKPLKSLKKGLKSQQ